MTQQAETMGQKYMRKYHNAHSGALYRGNIAEEIILMPHPGLRRTPLILPSRPLYVASGNDQPNLIDKHYSEEAGLYVAMYHQSDEEAYAQAIKKGTVKDFLCYRNVSVGADMILIDNETPFLINSLLRDKPILSLGDGPGELPSFFPFIPDDRFVGYDIAHTMVEVARSRHKRKIFIVADTTEVEFSEGAYGAVVGNYGIGTYWKDFLREGKKIYKMLDDKGTVCLGFYSHKILSGLPLEDSTTKQELEMGIELMFYTAEEAKKLLIDSGFPYVLVRGTNFDCTELANKLFKRDGTIHSPAYWQREILIRDEMARETGKKEHEARFLTVYASKIPFQIRENGKELSVGM